MWFNAMGPTTSYDGVVITSFRSWYGKAAWSFITYSLAGRQPYSFPFTSLSFPLCLALLFLLAKPELFWILFLLSVDENIQRQFQLDLAAKSAAYRPNRPALHFSPNDPIGSRQNWRPFWKLSINNRRTAIIFIRFLAYFPEANLSSTSSHQYSGNNQRLFTNNPKIFKDFHQHPKIFEDFFACKMSEPQIINNIPEIFKDLLGSNQQQQSTAATSSSNQQQQPAAAINSSNQQQQPTAATSINNPQQQLAATTSFRPTSSTYAIHGDFR